MKIRDKDLDLKKNTYVMGILNVTPDSFSDGGLHNSNPTALEHAMKMVKEGADIIDVGGESTRPGYEPVPADIEIQRVVPVIEAIRKVSGIPISVDTTKPSVAAAAMAAGADIINSVSGLAADADMIKVVKETDAVFVMTYEKNYVNQFGEELIKMAESAVEAGISEDKIILDPGIGFGKTYEENLRILNELPVITQTGYPILLGCSRKSVIERATDAPCIKDRLAGTIVTTVLAAFAGVFIVRVHDVADNVRAIRMLRAVCEDEDGQFKD
ncbi:MAG: dihydropteroate synthase [Lachnospiraceae bacterium]|nr:dihydropteroate synthase [Lachnospiraceae bacterium]